MTREEFIKDISEELIHELYKLDDGFDWDYSDESYEKCFCQRVKIKYRHSDNDYCYVTAVVDWPYFGPTTFWTEIDNGEGKNGHYKYYDSIEKAICEYLLANLDTSDLLGSLLDQLRAAAADEWEDHGFASASDYYNWRYGRSR